MGRRRRPKRTADAVTVATSETPYVPPWRRPIVGLLLVLLLGGTLRLVAFGTSPPGLNQDEAAEAWNAWTLLKTGKDQTGRAWPLLYSRGHGSNRSTLFMYLLIPFEVVGGLSPLVNRAPSPLIGLLTIAATYGVGRRLFGPAVGLMAALILALNPWHVQLSRWGHQTILCPLLAVGGVWVLLWMGLGIDGSKPRPHAAKALAAGFIWGIATWAYPSSRLFGAVFFVGIGMVAWRAWLDYVRAPCGPRAVAAMALMAGGLVAPMAYYHLRHPEIMSVRLERSAVFKPDDPTAAKLWKMASRYPAHFGPDFLFVNGDHYEIQSPPGFGEFHWYMLPGMLVGLMVTGRRARSSFGARILLVWLAAYPVGDCLSWHLSMHALRSSPGICGLILLSALGFTSAGLWLWQRYQAAALAAGALTVVVAIGLNVRFLHYFYGEYNCRPMVYHLGYHVDLLEACDWLRHRLDEVDAVFCTTRGMNLPYSISLLGLSYDADQWFDGVRDVETKGEWDRYTRYGKMNFMYGRSFMPRFEELRGNGRKDRVVFIIRPGEMRLKPTHEIIGPDGRPVLWICEATL